MEERGSWQELKDTGFLLNEQAILDMMNYPLIIYLIIIMMLKRSLGLL